MIFPVFYGVLLIHNKNVGIYVLLFYFYLDL